MANLFSRIGASVSALVDRVFNRNRPKVNIGHTRVECIYGPPEMLAARRGSQRRAVEPEPDPEPVDLYGPPLAGEEEPEEDEEAVEETAAEEEPIHVQPVSREMPERMERMVCVYGPPPSR